MFEKFKRSRWVRLIAVAFMVPVVLFSNEATASAVVSNEAEVGAKPFKIKVAHDYFPDANCSGTVTVSRTNWSIFDGKCKGGTDTSPMFTQRSEPGSTYQLLFKSQEGATCHRRVYTFTDHSDDSIWAVVGGISEAGLFATGCRPAEMCIGSLRGDGGEPEGNVPEDTPDLGNEWGCTDVEPAPEPSTCDQGAWTSTFVGDPVEGPNPSGGKVMIQGFTFYHSFESLAGEAWWFYIIYDNFDGGGGTALAQESLIGRIKSQRHPAGPFVGSLAETNVSVHASDSWRSGAAESPAAVRGVGVFRHPGTGTTSSRMSTPANNAAGLVGVHDPATCAFYQGDKLWDDNQLGEGRDEPGGAMPGSEAPTDPIPEDEEADDESPWWKRLLGALRELWGWLGKILSAILGLPGKIASELAGLIVPERGFMDGKLDGLTDDLAASGPGQYVSAVGDLLPSGGASGCAGPALQFQASGQTQRFEPLNACSGPRATLASASTVLISVSSVLFGGLACVRAIGSGFGWAPGVAD